MKYPQYVHWSEGQFLQPHHFQQMQHSLLSTIYAERSLYTPYTEGLISLDVDTDALRANRVVIKSLNAIMPDGVGISCPGNCVIEPLSISFNASELDSLVTVYLCVPRYLENEPNITRKGDLSYGRYCVHASEVADENTGDSVTTIISRRINTRLITDPKSVTDCTVLPVLRLNWVSLENNEHYLEIDRKYVPPYVVLDDRSSLFTMVREFIYELKSYKSKILSDIESEGFDPNILSGSGFMRLMQLQQLNISITDLTALLIPQRVSPFTLYLKLSETLSALKAFFPLSDSKEVVNYDHYDLFTVFKELLFGIRSLITSQGKAECMEIDFIHNESQNCLSAKLEDEHIVKAKDYYIALSGNLDWKSLIEDIETGDNFRVLDLGSKDSRVRGLKLSYVRFPPRYLPVAGSDTVFFKIMRDESPRIWRYIVEDHSMVIDYAQSTFAKFSAKLYVAIVDEEALN
ncbi:MAG: type VI secretion system baseplate subunit TssK [Succinivibrio sp.]